MLKLIRLFPNQDLFTLQGYGVPADSTLVGSAADARAYMTDRIGVEPSEVDLALNCLKTRPDHNAADFGVTWLGFTTTLAVDVSDIHRRMGVGPSGLVS